ncbi:3263_t:CDS:2 [Entrophospora sp. SA101]|nr:3263_t:CDS:2 [Entrophospora sp. SA101]
MNISNVTNDEKDFDNSFFINEKNDIFIEYSDHFLRARSLRVLCITLIIFLCSLWILTNFDGKEVNFHGAHYYKSSKVAIVAASVMGDNGEEGIQGLEIANHFGGSHHGIHSFYDDDEEDEEDVNFHNLHDHKSESENDIASNNIDSISSINNNRGSDDISSNTKDNNTSEDNLEIEIEKLINESPIVIFSKSYCPYSRRAKHIFSIYDVLPHISVIEVDERDDSEQVKQTLIRLTYQSTFPNIFIDGKSIGGSYELAIMHRKHPAL